MKTIEIEWSPNLSVDPMTITPVPIVIGQILRFRCVYRGPLPAPDSGIPEGWVSVGTPEGDVIYHFTNDRFVPEVDSNDNPTGNFHLDMTAAEMTLMLGTYCLEVRDVTPGSENVLARRRFEITGSPAFSPGTNPPIAAVGWQVGGLNANLSGKGPGLVYKPGGGTEAGIIVAIGAGLTVVNPGGGAPLELRAAGGSGLGDMLASVYDTDGDGVVDAAESVPWAGIVGTPATFPPATHAHAESDVTGLVADLAGKQPLDADLTALAALAGTNTIYYRSGANTWAAVTIGSGLTFSGGTLSASGGGGGMAIGGSVASGTAGRVLFEGTGPVLADDAGLTYDAAADALTAGRYYAALSGPLTPGPGYAFTGFGFTGMYSPGSNALYFASGGDPRFAVLSGDTLLANNTVFSWCTATFAVIGTSLLQEATGILAQRNGNTPETYRLYLTYADVNNYARGTVGWVNNLTAGQYEFTIGTEAAGTGTLWPVRIKTRRGHSLLIDANGGTGDKLALYASSVGGMMFAADNSNATVEYWIVEGSFGSVMDAPGGALTRHRIIYGSNSAYVTMHSNGSLDLSTSANCVAIMAKDAAPPDASMLNSRAVIYLDEAGGNVKMKVRLSDGTYRSVTIPFDP
jgi:hypothetical protein